MSRRHLTVAATLAGLTLLAAGCGGGGGSDAAAGTTPDPAALIAAEAAVTPGLVALGVTAPDPADARLRAFGEFGTPADVFKPRVSDVEGTTTVPSTVSPTETVPVSTTTPTTTAAPFVP